jgi:hypothetical protein
MGPHVYITPIITLYMLLKKSILYISFFSNWGGDKYIGRKNTSPSCNQQYGTNLRYMHLRLLEIYLAFENIQKVTNICLGKRVHFSCWLVGSKYTVY